MPKPRVLCIDDDLVSTEFVKLALQPDYEVATYNDSIDAINRVAEFRPDLLLLDIMMPEVDGRELLETLRSVASLRSIPVVLLSGNADEADLDALARLGARGLIEKGVTATELKQHVNYALTNPI